jgi:curved DNA-binding protein CbpA
MPPTPLPAPQAQAIEELYTRLETATHYELLGLAPDADEAAVKQAYYAVSRKWHPDHFSKYKGAMGIHADYVESIFVAMNQAYQTLRDPTEAQGLRP